MSTTTEETALATRREESTELAITAQQAMAEKEIEASIIVANRFPRNEDAVYERVMKSCSRFNFAAMACYSYPRGGQQIQGPSVNLARETARLWGNIRYGAEIVHDDETSRTVRGWAWDVQTNARESQDATFRKLIYRKKTGWQTPDERDLRELTNKHAAIAVRNCLLHLMPPDLIDDAIAAAKRTLKSDAGRDPDEARKRLVRAFLALGVSVGDLELYLGHPLRQITAAEIADLRGVYKSILDGNSLWKEHIGAVTTDVTEAAPGQSKSDALAEQLREQTGAEPEPASVVAEPVEASEGKPAGKELF